MMFSVSWGCLRMPNDSELLHRRPYDPVKAHEYYMRTRKLKGRPQGSSEIIDPRSRAGSSTSGKGPKKSGSELVQPKGPSREELEAQKDALQKRLLRLKEELRKLVRAAKTRSGIVEKEPEKKSSESKKNKESDEKKESEPEKEEKLTSSEKKEKAKKARETYEKEKKKSPTPSSEIAALERQIQDVRKRIKAALEDARKKAIGKDQADLITSSDQSKSKTASKGR